MREKMAFLFFAYEDKLSPEEFRKRAKDIMKRKQLVLTVYWNRYVELYEKQRKPQAVPKLPKKISGLVRVLKPKDKKVLYE
jgi:hypothetical protein